MKQIVFLLVLCILTASGFAVFAQTDEMPPAPIINDEGGTVSITGEMVYTNTLFTAGVAQPLIILEDQAGFVRRDNSFLMPIASQTLGQITSDFYQSPVSYSIALPIQPQGTFSDVDNDGETDPGVQIYAVAYWSNTFGDPYLEERDLYGGGWSTAYASTRVSEDLDTLYEIIGGKLLIYAPDDEQGFPSNFGDDGLLFTEDDPVVRLPQGYTVVDLDTDPFTFDRSAEVIIDLIEPEGAALDDFSDMSYTEAFDAMIEKMRTEYAFTEYKGIDWDALADEYRPRFERAEREDDQDEYIRALQDFLWEIPDGHIALYPGAPVLGEDFQNAVLGGIGLVIRELDDGRVIVTNVIPNSSADDAGIEVRAEVLSINGTDITTWIDNTFVFDGPFSTDHVRRLSQLRYATRFPYGETVEVEFQNPDANPQTVELFAGDEVESFNSQSSVPFDAAFELPVEYSLLPSGYGYVSINSFSDNDLLSIQLWERMIQTLNSEATPGLIIDMRRNGGGSGFLADQMAAYFFNEELILGTSYSYDRALGEFVTDEDRPERFFLPPEELRYNGTIAVLVGPDCVSACEFFAYNMTLQNRAAVVGQYPTAGLGGGVQDFAMPDGQFVRFTVGRAVDANGEIHIEGIGIVPTVQVPVTEETLFYDGDVILDYAIDYLDENATELEPNVSRADGGNIQVFGKVDGEIGSGERIRYTLTANQDDTLTIMLNGIDGLDTYLRVYNVAGDLIDENDDIETGRDLSSRIEGLDVSAGDVLLIEVGTYADASSGEFMLQVEGER